MADEPVTCPKNHESELIMNVKFRRKAPKLVMAIIALAAFCGTTASAHHSFAKFEMGTLTTLTGTVQEWTWANPHTWLKVTVKKANGTTETWALVGSSPNMMSRWGWKPPTSRLALMFFADAMARPLAQCGMCS
jgi:Family of unknown function (DUF6152)